MKFTPRILKTLADLPWHNNFVWFPNGYGGGHILYREFNENETHYWLYTIPNSEVTPEMYCSLPEGAPFQLIQGQLIFMATPSDNHQQVQFNVSRHVGNFVEDNDLGKVRNPPTDVQVNGNTRFQPDLLFVHKSRTEIITPKEGLAEGPDLAVEILSPSTRKHDEGIKLELFGEAGTVEYWLIHPDEKWVKQYVLDEETKTLLLAKHLEHEEEELHSVALPGFVLTLKQIFKGTR